MAKRLFLLLIFSIITIVNTPNFLMATDSVLLSRINNKNIVETIPLPEPEPEPEPEYLAQSSQIYQTNYAAYQAPAAPTAGAAIVTPANNIQINGRIIELGYTGSTQEDAGGATYAWYYSSGSFIYGHNSSNVSGFLDSAYDGNWLEGISFTVSMNGTTDQYTIINHRLYDFDGTSLWYQGERAYMRPLTSANLDGVHYRMAIMTCYAGSSKRLVVFAN